MTATQTKESQAKITPEQALERLKKGNRRFVEAEMHERDLRAQVSETSTGQYPFATILHCIDSRVSAELIFDQGIGDLFSVRIAGNQVNDDILGSMEFACKLAGTKVLLVLGHTSCGAVKGACDHAEMGNLTGLLKKIEPAVYDVREPKKAADRTSKNLEFVDAVAKRNVEFALNNIRMRSQVLRDMEQNEEILLLGGMYDISNGEVTFYE